MKNLKVILITMIPALALGLALLAGLSRLRAGAWNGRILALALARANSALAGQVTAAGLQGDPLSRFLLVGLEVSDPAGRVVFQAAQVEAEWQWLRSLFLRPSFKIRLQGAKLVAVKTGDQWNFSRLKKSPRRSASPVQFPRLEAQFVLQNCELLVSLSSDRSYQLWIAAGAAEVKTRPQEVDFEVAALQGSIDPPAVGIGRLTLAGRVISVARGWEVRFDSGQARTTSGELDLRAGRYSTATSHLAAEFPWLDLAPDAIELGWPSSPVLAPVAGAGSVQGDLQHLGFQVRLESPAGAADLTGTYDRPRARIELSGSVREFTLARLIDSSFAFTDLTGDARLVYQAEANPAVESGRRYLRVSSRLTSFRYPEIKSFPLEVEFERKGDAYTVATTSASPGLNHELHLAGNFQAPYPFTLKTKFRDLNPEQLRAGMPAGVLTGTFELQGQGQSIESLEASGRMQLETALLEGITIEDAVIPGAIRHGQVRVERAQGTGAGVLMGGEGEFDLVQEKVPFHFDLEGKVADPAAISRWSRGAVAAEQGSFRISLRGDKFHWRVSGNGEADRVTAAPLVAVSASLRAEFSSAAGGKVSGQVEISARSAKLPSLEYAQFQVPTFDLQASAEIAPSPLQAPQLRFKMKAASREPGFRFSAAGKFESQAQGPGWLLDLAALEFSLIGESWQLAAPAQAEARQGEIWFQGFDLKSGREQVVLNGEVWGPSLNLTLGLRGFELDPWTAKLLPADTIHGVISGDWVVKGPASAPEIQGDWQILRPRFRNAELEQASGSLHSHGAQMDFQARGRSSVTGEAEARGTLPLRLAAAPVQAEFLSEAKMDLQLQAAELSAQAIGGLIPGLQDLGGRISVAVRLQGTLGKPRWDGRVGLKEVRFSVPAWGLMLSEVSGEATIADNRVNIPALVMRSGDKPAKLSGEFLLRGLDLAEMNLAIEAQGFQALNAPDVQATVNADLRLTGNLEAPRLTGRIEFIELHYRPPLLFSHQGTAWENEDPTVQVKGQAPKPVGQGPWLDRFAMNLKIVIADTARLRSSELSVRFGGDLNFEKPAGKLIVLSGKVESKEGWIFFQGKPFQLEQGTFVFPGIPEIDPDLDLQASYRVPDYTISIKIGGTLSKPTLELSSTPSLDPADALAVLLFGQPVNNLTEGQRQSLARSGGELVAGYAATSLGHSLADALNLDTVVLQPGASPENTMVGVGKYLNERLYVFYYHHFGPETTEEFKARYDLRQHVFLEGGRDQTGQGGADIYFSHPY